MLRVDHVRNVALVVCIFTSTLTYALPEAGEITTVTSSPFTSVTNNSNWQPLVVFVFDANHTGPDVSDGLRGFFEKFASCNISQYVAL